MKETEVYRHQMVGSAALQGAPPCEYLLLLFHKMLHSNNSES